MERLAASDAQALVDTQVGLMLLALERPDGGEHVASSS
jgi:hypothetical protein